MAYAAQVVEEEAEGSGSVDPKSEEGMLGFIKGFDAEEIKGFIESQAHLPPSIHHKFSALRQALGTRRKQFCDLPEVHLQVKYFYDLFQDYKVFPTAWLNFASSVGYFHGQTGRFVENSESVFRTEALLGRMLSMRAKYTILGLKDLLSMRALSATTSESQEAMASNLQRFSSQVEMVADDAGSSTFLSALAAFDSETRLR